MLRIKVVVLLFFFCCQIWPLPPISSLNLFFFFFARCTFFQIILSIKFISRGPRFFSASIVCASFLLLSNLSKPLRVSFHEALALFLERLIGCRDVPVSMRNVGLLVVFFFVVIVSINCFNFLLWIIVGCITSICQLSFSFPHSRRSASVVRLLMRCFVWNYLLWVRSRRSLFVRNIPLLYT